MENRGQGKCLLPEELHRYVLDQPRDPLPPDMSSDAGSSHTYERQSSRRFSYSPHPPSLTPATFPREASTEPAASPSRAPSEWSSTETSSWRSHTLEGRWSAEEGYDLPPPRRGYEFQTSTVTGYLSRSYSEERRQTQGTSHHAYEHAGTARPPPHYPDSHHGGHYDPMHGVEEWSGTPCSSGDVASTSKFVLPPVSQLLGAVDARELQTYEIPVLPRLQDDQPGELSLPKGKERTRGEIRGSPEAGPSTSVMSKAQGKKRQTEGAGDTEEEGGEEKKSKAVRKIYVACDFCRGRKLRCDGSKPSCSNCATRSLVCKYQDHPRRRGPGKAPKGSREKRDGNKKRGSGKSSKTVDSEPPAQEGESQTGFYQFSLEEPRRRPAR